MSENDNVKDILAAGAALGEVRATGDGSSPFVVVPEDYKLQDVERILPAPTRNRGTTQLLDEDSFIAFVTQHKTESTDLYFNSRDPRFTAVFNAARVGAPAWADHKAVYSMPLSREWQAWKSNSGKKMTQEEFAQFIEMNLPDIIEPNAADMLEVALSLEAKKKVNFASGLRLSNGSNQLTYEEQVDGTAAKGNLQVPEQIALAIPVFEGGDRYRVEAKFRYRIQDGGKLSMWYELVRDHKIIEDAVQQARKVIETGTGLVAFNAAGV